MTRQVLSKNEEETFGTHFMRLVNYIHRQMFAFAFLLRRGTFKEVQNSAGINLAVDNRLKLPDVNGF